MTREGNRNKTRESYYKKSALVANLLGHSSNRPCAFPLEFPKVPVVGPFCSKLECYYSGPNREPLLTPTAQCPSFQFGHDGKGIRVGVAAEMGHELLSQIKVVDHEIGKSVRQLRVAFTDNVPVLTPVTK